MIEEIEKTLKYVKSLIFLSDTMTNMTLSMPDHIHQRMKKHPEIRWSEVARRAIIEKLARIELADDLAKDSKLTQEDVEEIDAKIRKAAAKRFNDHSRALSRETNPERTIFFLLLERENKRFSIINEEIV